MDTGINSFHFFYETIATIYRESQVQKHVTLFLAYSRVLVV